MNGRYTSKPTWRVAVAGLLLPVVVITAGIEFVYLPLAPAVTLTLTTQVFPPFNVPSEKDSEVAPTIGAKVGVPHSGEIGI